MRCSRWLFAYAAIGLQLFEVVAVEVSVDPSCIHEVGGVRAFDRSKFITIHASIGERCWTEDVRGEGNFTEDLLADFFEGYDVYFGRDTGQISYQINRMIKEDPARSGWPLLHGDPRSIEAQGLKSREAFERDARWHPYEYRAESAMICSQYHPFWPDGTAGKSGWAFSQVDSEEEPFGTATGFFMAQFMNHFYGHAENGNIGCVKPSLVEVINEPDWELWGLHAPTNARAGDPVWSFHNSVAREIKRVNPEVKVGGFCNAFPDHQYNEFQEWNREWKAFIDHCGSNMDFYTLHLYGFDDPYADWERKGCNLEATLDLIEHYSHLKVGRTLPFVISEYGDRARKLENGPWCSLRDWKFLKATHSMLMSFADRPHLIEKTIPFLLCKAEWGRGDYPKAWRLMRQKNEPESCTGEWVYTDVIKFYDLWKEVKGTRVRVSGSDPDIQLDAYVDGNKLFVVMNNLQKKKTSIRLAPIELRGNPVQQVLEKNFYLSDDQLTTLDKREHGEPPKRVVLGAEGGAVVQYTFEKEVVFSALCEEVKYYANEYMRPIIAGKLATFSFSAVEIPDQGEAVLRLGIGRDKKLNRYPRVWVNGEAVKVRRDYMGNDAGDDRPEFFGVLDVPIPISLLQKENRIEVSFSKTGGHVASAALRVFSQK